jgi:glucose 1-dehydrogenase
VFKRRPKAGEARRKPNDHDLRLDGQRALVTGGDSGIGAGVAEALSEAGAKVAINYAHGEDKAHAVAARLQANGAEVLVIQADVGEEDQVKDMVGKVCSAWGSLDILVANSGIQRDAPFLDMTLTDWEMVLRVNLTGQFLCAREAAREFVRRGIVPDLSRAAGKIICTSSVHDRIPWAGHVNYATSKGGISMLVKTMAQELAQYRIRVNAISPGAIKTPINRSAWDTPEAEAELLHLIPYGRVGEPADVGRLAAWLVSDAADYITGATVYIDGGMMLYPGFRTGG